MANYNTYSIQPNVSAGVRHERYDLIMAGIVSLGQIQQELEPNRTITP